MTQEKQNDLRTGFETAYINSNVVSNPSYKPQFIFNNHREFGELWNSQYALPFRAFFDNYRERYKIIKRQREIAKKEAVVSIEKYRLQPNTMQVSFKRVIFLVHRGQLACQTLNRDEHLLQYRPEAFDCIIEQGHI